MNEAIDLPLKRALISLGSNLGNRSKFLALARQAISKSNRILRRSRELNNPPLIITEQPFFLNQIIEIETCMSPEELLDFLKETEKKLGRKSRERYGPREIDLDILDYEGIELSTDRLTLPHPGLSDRKYLHQLLSEPPFQALHLVHNRLCLFGSLLGCLTSGILMLPFQPILADVNSASQSVLIEQSSLYYHSAPESEEVENIYLKVKDGFLENDIQGIDAATLNQVAVVAATKLDLDTAESLFRFSIQKLADPTYSLLLRLNLIYLYLDNNIHEADSMLFEILGKANESQRLFIYHGLVNRKFDSAANQFLRQWLDLAQGSNELMQAGLETATYFETIGKTEIGVSLLKQLDIRSGGTNSKVVESLARLSPSSKEAIDYYKRLFNLVDGKSDEAYGRYALLQLNQHNVDEANSAFAKINNLQLTDIKNWATTQLKQNPNSNIEPILAKAKSLPLSSFADQPSELWSNYRTQNITLSARFYDLLYYTDLLMYQSTAVEDLRTEIYGISDLNQISTDRNLIQALY